MGHSDCNGHCLCVADCEAGVREQPSRRFFSCFPRCSGRRRRTCHHCRLLSESSSPCSAGLASADRAGMACPSTSATGRSGQYWPYILFGGALSWHGLYRRTCIRPWPLCSSYPSSRMRLPTPSMCSKTMCSDHSAMALFEHEWKVIVDFGLFLFGLANAGVRFAEYGNGNLARHRCSPDRQNRRHFSARQPRNHARFSVASEQWEERTTRRRHHCRIRLHRGPFRLRCRVHRSCRPGRSQDGGNAELCIGRHCDHCGEAAGDKKNIEVISGYS